MANKGNTKTALYPGSFDPITKGHIDIIKRALDIFDNLIIAVAANPAKDTLFSSSERVKLIRGALGDDERITVTHFTGLTSTFAQKSGVNAIIRGLRMVSDFEYEFQMALMNRKLVPEADTVFLMPSEQYTYLSSSLVKDISRYQGKIECFVPPNVAEALRKKFKSKKR
ncbi:MAG: pantetheine-phosphate adenylyltransferase [candidate division Zixibacteria bacterium]|nr:pantetheine-phosphate adenylyltransferase [candidate division Zixibacteria bacterium]